MLSKIESTPYIYSQMKWMKLFTQEQAKEIKKNITEFLSEMHKKWVYHRDLGGSLRNILLSSDGKITIIDFWKAIRIPGGENKKEIYKEKNTHGINEYFSDEEILNIIDAYTEEE
jgi:serine/threonine protein kinase